MKKLITTTALLVAFAAAQAQSATPAAKGTNDPKAMEQRSQANTDKRVELMTQQLNLTAEQAAAIRVIEDRHLSGMNALRGSSEQGDVLRASLAALNQKREEETKAVLTPEQYAKMLELRDTKRNARKEVKAPHNE